MQRFRPGESPVEGGRSIVCATDARVSRHDLGLRDTDATRRNALTWAYET